MSKYVKNLTDHDIRVDTFYKGVPHRFDIPVGEMTKLEWAEDDQPFKNILKNINRKVVECDEDGNEI